MTKEKQIKPNELARMVQRGFEGVDKRFDKVDERLDRIENILIRGHDNRLEKLEDFMLQAKTLLKIK